MKPTLKLAHCSDIHLDYEYYGGDRNLHLHDYYRDLFGKLLEGVRAAKPDALLLAGDLFDHNRAAEPTVNWAMEMLGKLPFPVVMIPGNHDCLIENGVYLRHDFNVIPNVTLLDDEHGIMTEIADLSLQVWGKGMREHTPENQPLAGMPGRSNESHWHVGMGHGIPVAHGDECLNSSPIHEAQIESSEFDYLALGHLHAMRDVSTATTPAFYCGAPGPIVDDRGTWLMTTLAEGKTVEVEINELDLG
ncbi:MAG: DNA repair exonuclease [Gammaproteobacteria bacterium]